MALGPNEGGPPFGHSLHYSIQEHSCFKFAFLLLHNLMSDRRIGRKVIAYMCEMRVLTKVMGWLDHKNEKFLNIVTDIVHMLISRNSEQMVRKGK